MPPAARMTDFQTCPMLDGPVPHVGGILSDPVAATVMIGGLPAAFIGTLGICEGPPTTVISGSATVMVENMPAARMGDSTDHGGLITTGCETVMIGG